MITSFFFLILIFLIVIFLPIGHEGDKVRRLPWISIIIMASCIIIYIPLSIQQEKTAKELLKATTELQQYYYQHPYLELDPEIKKQLFGEIADEDIDKLLGIDRKKKSRQIRLFQEEEQDRLDQLAQQCIDTIDDLPHRKWGFFPAQKSFIGLLTHMFVHGDFFHLFFNLLFLYVCGPFIEEVWGRPIYTAFYLTSGMFAALMLSLYYPNSTIPLIGASGAIAGLMGAFLIRYWKVRIRFFWLIFFLVTRRTFYLPARLVLPLWLALQLFWANLIDHFLPGKAVSGTAYWAHIWGFLFGVIVAAGMKRFKIEQKYVNPKIEAQVHFVDEEYKAFEEAKLKINEGKADDAYVLLLGAARKNPMNRDVVESLWNQGNELGKEKEAAEFFIRLIESEIRRDQLDVAFVHFMELRGKVPQASISMTCKFMLMKYLTERQDYKEAKELTSELMEEVDLNSSPVLLQDFARAASEHSPEVAKKTTEMCLQHPGIADFQKDALRTKLKELENRIQAAPAESDMGQAETDMRSMGHEAEPGFVPESQPGSGPEVQPLADSVGQTREELIGQVGVNPESKPAVVTEIQYKTQPEGQPAVKQESQPVVEPQGESEVKSESQPEVKPGSQPLVEPEGQLSATPENQSAAEPEVQPLAESIGQAEEELRGQSGVDAENKPVVIPESQSAAKPEVRPFADSVGQTQEELRGQRGVNPENKPAVVSEIQYKTQPEGQPAVKQESQQVIEPQGEPLAEPEGQLSAVPESQPVVESEVQPAVELESQPGIEPESQPAGEPEVQPLAESIGQAEEELSGQSDVEPDVQRGPEPLGQPEIESGSKPAVEPQSEPVVESEGQPSVVPESQTAAEPVDQTEVEPGIEFGVESEGQPEVESDKPEISPSPDQSIMAIKATPLNVKDGKIALNMDQIGQQLLPLNKVKTIAVAEIAPDQQQPYLLIDLFLDDPKTNDHEIRSIRLLSTTFDPTKFSPGIQDQQDALKVFVSVLLKLSGATAYPDEDSILLDSPQSFFSIEDYEKSILA